MARKKKGQEYFVESKRGYSIYKDPGISSYRVYKKGSRYPKRVVATEWSLKDARKRTR